MADTMKHVFFCSAAAPSLASPQVFRGLQADAMDIARTASEAESRSAGLVQRLSELESLIADERAKWQARIIEESSASGPASAVAAMMAAAGGM